MTEPFVLDGRTSNVVAEISTTLSQSWAYFTLTLVDEETRGQPDLRPRGLLLLRPRQRRGLDRGRAVGPRVAAVGAGRPLRADRGAGGPAAVQLPRSPHARRAAAALRVAGDRGADACRRSCSGGASGASRQRRWEESDHPMSAELRRRRMTKRVRGVRRAWCWPRSTWVHLTGWSPANVTEEKGIPKSVRDNPGSSRSSYGARPYTGAK